MWTEKHFTCPVKGIPRLKFESTVTNESLVMVVVISVAPFPVNSTSEKEGKNKFSFGRIFSLNLHHHHPFIIWQRVKSVSVVLLPYPGGKHTCDPSPLGKLQWLLAYFFFLIFIYLARSGLSWWHAGFLLWRTDSQVVAQGLRCPVASVVPTSPTRDQTHIHCVARQILNHWTTREVPLLLL